eukprot:scaffold152072_cov17-Tisochrysis_lutea.AAC.3
MRSSQCRCRMAGLRKSVMSGIVFLNASTVSFIHARAGQVLISRPSLLMALPMRPAASSICSTCNPKNPNPTSMSNYLE